MAAKGNVACTLTGKLPQSGRGPVSFPVFSSTNQDRATYGEVIRHFSPAWENSGGKPQTKQCTLNIWSSIKLTMFTKVHWNSICFGTTEVEEGLAYDTLPLTRSFFELSFRRRANDSCCSGRGCRSPRWLRMLPTFFQSNSDSATGPARPRCEFLEELRSYLLSTASHLPLSLLVVVWCWGCNEKENIVSERVRKFTVFSSFGKSCESFHFRPKPVRRKDSPLDLTVL